MSSLSKYIDGRFGGSQEILSNPYYNAIIESHMDPQLRAETYMEELNREHFRCDLRFMHGVMKDFKPDFWFNAKLGLPYGTYSVRITNDFLDLYVDKFVLHNYDINEKTYTYSDGASSNAPKYLDNSSRAAYDKEANAIVDTKTRVAFKDFKSPRVYSYTGKNRIFSMMDTHYYTSIFKRGLYFFIGDYLFTGIKIIPFKDFCYFVIIPDAVNGLTRDQVEYFIENNVDWKLMLAPHSNFFTHTGSVETTFEDGGIPISLFNKEDSVGSRYAAQDNFFFIGTTTYDEINNDGKGIPISKNLMNFHRSKLSQPSTNEYIYNMEGQEISATMRAFPGADIDSVVFNFQNVASIVSRGDNKEPFTLDFLTGSNAMNRKTFIVPPENVIIWKNDKTTGRITLDPDTVASLYYPNAYKLSGEYFDQDTEDREVLFMANTRHYKSIDLKEDRIEPEFYCEIMPYVQFMGNDYAQKCVDGTLIPELDSYQPIQNKFGWADYRTYDKNNDQSFLDYEHYKFDTFMNENQNKLIDYYRQLRDLYLKYIHEYDVPVKDINLMEQTPVKNNHNEITNKTQWVDFDQEMYVIHINQRSDYPSEFTVYLDEDYVTAKKYYREGFNHYIYIPTALVQEDSILHICIFINGHVNDNPMDIIFTDDGTGYYIKTNNDWYIDTKWKERIKGIAGGGKPDKPDEIADKGLVDDAGHPLNPDTYPFGYYIMTKDKEYLLTDDNRRIRYGQLQFSNEGMYRDQPVPSYLKEFNPRDIIAYVSSHGANQYKYLTIGSGNSIELNYLIHIHRDELDKFWHPEEVGLNKDNTDANIRIPVESDSKTVQNRVMSQTVKLANNSSIYNAPVKNNSSWFTDEAHYKEWDEDHIEISLYAGPDGASNPFILYIDDVIADMDKIDRFFTKVENIDITLVYIPISMVSKTSVLRFETLITDERDPVDWHNYRNTPELEIALKDDTYINTSIRVKATDVYDSYKLEDVSSDDQIVFHVWKWDPVKEKIRVWLIEPEDPVRAGTLINPEMYSCYFPVKYGDDMTIIFSGDFTPFENKSIMIEHLPYRMYHTLHSEVTEDNVYDVPYNNASPFWEFFADGKRIPSDQIRWITPTKVLILDDDYETIDGYNYGILGSLDQYRKVFTSTPENTIMDKLIESDPKFKKYCIDMATDNSGYFYWTK